MAASTRFAPMLVSALALYVAGCTNLVISDPSQLPRTASDFVYPGYKPSGNRLGAGGHSGHDMSTMQGMPGTESKLVTAAKQKLAAGGHDMPGMQGMPATESKPETVAKPKPAAGGHDMSSMYGTVPKVGGAQKPQAGGHDMRGMQGMPRTATAPATAAKPHAADGHGHEKESMQGMQSGASNSGGAQSPAVGAESGHKMEPKQNMPGMAKPGSAPTGSVAGTGVVKGIDKANGTIQLTHDPIQAMGWPRMTLSFRLKENSLADRVMQGDAVAFTLEKSATGYLISNIEKKVAGTR